MSHQRPPSHFVPRTRDGWIATITFLALLLLAMPPSTHVFLDRTDPWVFGVTFFYFALFAIYVALVGVLVWTYRRRV